MTVRRPLLLVTCAAVLAATACSGDDDEASDSSPPTAPAATTTPATPADPVTTVGTAGGPTAAPTVPAATAPPPTTPPTAAEPGAEPAVTFTEIASLEAPVDMTWRDGDDGLYVVEQAGRIVRLGDGEAQTVLDVTDLTEANGEQGLLGLAFSPAGDLAYINYTDNRGDTVIGEYPVEPDGTFQTGDLARVVLEIDQPYANHNGGDLTFGPDELLYIGMGDGGSGGDPERRATDMSSLLGKLLRIDPTPSGGQPYTVPPDNPFVGEDGAAPEIWASGLRNPWRFSFDRETGDLWIADVGQNAIEEIDVAPATGGLDAGKGLSFGWSAFEGDQRFNDDVPAEGHVPPFSTYTHADGSCSISGGVRARGGPVAELIGWYVYADYCSGNVWAVEVTGGGSSMAPGRTVELGHVADSTAVVEGPSGELYVLSRAGPVLRLDPP